MLTRPDPQPGPWDADLTRVRVHVGNVACGLSIWQARSEPDARARRAANGTIDAIDAAMAELHAIRARLVGEVREADDATAARADALLARTRDGPPVPSRPEGRRQSPTTSSRSPQTSTGIVGRGGDRPGAAR